VQARALKPHEGLKLHRLKRQFVNQVNHRHARIILLSRGGLSNAPIAPHCDRTATWVRRMIHRFHTGVFGDCTASGPRVADAWNLQPRPGRPRLPTGRHHARTGHGDRLRATYNHKGGVRHMFAAYDMESDKLIGPLAAQKNGTTFLPFLQQLRRRYRPGETLHIVLDNAKYRRKAEVQH
jgi:hypothetical protein